VAGGGICAQSNTFNAAGVYTSTVVVSDDDGGTSAPATVVIVVFNPNSKVTGGGTMQSPAGAVVANPLVSGRAQFNLNPQYHKGDTTPSGKAKFTFKNAGLDFDSTILEWLVVTGSKGQLRGSGTINNAGNYGFLMTVTDGKLLGGGGMDKFRLKIWDNSAGDAVVYDNVPGAPDDIDIANPQATTGGSIVIHKEK
jgi:hypothetical protein